MWPLRCRYPGWLALAVLATACGSPTGNGPDGGGGDDGVVDAGVLPGFDAMPPMGLFPLQVSADGTHLTGHDGKPFLLHGEAAWSLIVQLSTNDAMRYLADRNARGVNTLIVNLIEHFYSDHPPSNAAGNAPFSKAGDFSTPSEAYFGHADVVIDLAASQGMVVLLTPSYLGINGGNEGWFQEMDAMGKTSLAKCTSYGNYLGQRYASKTNIIWMWGGDYTPPTGPGEACMKAISDAILAAAPPSQTLRATGHWNMETTSLIEPLFKSTIDIVGVYTYQLALPKCRAALSAPEARKPLFLMETCYEGEMFGRCPAASDVRRQQWWSILGCGAGEIYGVEGLWQFASNWQQKLGSPISVAEQRLFAIVQQVAWHTLQIDDALVSAGRGGAGSAAEVIATRTADGRQALIYMPPNAASTITVELGRLNGTVNATWQDPTADHSVAAGDGLSGSHDFTRPTGGNGGGANDWALVLTAQ
jgi:hypothetical protein